MQISKNTGMQGVHARYDTVLPPIMSIVLSPGRPVISIQNVVRPKKWDVAQAGFGAAIFRVFQSAHCTSTVLLLGAKCFQLYDHLGACLLCILQCFRAQESMLWAAPNGLLPFAHQSRAVMESCRQSEEIHGPKRFCVLCRKLPYHRNQITSCPSKNFQASHGVMPARKSFLRLLFFDFLIFCFFLFLKWVQEEGPKGGIRGPPKHACVRHVSHVHASVGHIVSSCNRCSSSPPPPSPTVPAFLIMLTPTKRVQARANVRWPILGSST